MAENKKSFVAYCDWENQLDLLSDEEAGKLFRHLLAYVNDRNPEFSNSDRILKMAFEPIRLQLKRDLDKYEEVKKKRSEAGRSGGLKSGVSRSKTEQTEANEANASQNQPNEAIGSFAKKNEANEAVTVNDNVNVNDNVILLEKETKEENLIKEFAEELFTDSTPDNPPEEKRKKVAQKKEKFKTPSLQEVQDYCNERQNGISAYSFVNFYQSKGWKVGNQPMKDWKAAIRTWEQKNKENGKSVNNTSNFGPGKGTTSVSNTASGKTSATTAIARQLKKLSSGNSEGGDITIDAEIL